MAKRLPRTECRGRYIIQCECMHVCTPSATVHGALPHRAQKNRQQPLLSAGHAAQTSILHVHTASTCLLSIQALVEDYTHRPHIHLQGGMGECSR